MVVRLRVIRDTKSIQFHVATALYDRMILSKRYNVIVGQRMILCAVGANMERILAQLNQNSDIKGDFLPWPMWPRQWQKHRCYTQWSLEVAQSTR